MQTNEFEKQVQQKMEELKIPPSGSVWQNVEQHIARNKRRKKAWIIFPLLFTGLLYGGYFFWHTSINSIKNHPETYTEKSLTKNNIANDLKENLKKPEVEKDIVATLQSNKTQVREVVKDKQNKKMFYSSVTQKRQSSKSTIISADSTPVLIAGAIYKKPEEDRSFILKNSKERLFADQENNFNPASKDTAATEQESKMLPAHTDQFIDTLSKHDTSFPSLKIVSVNIGEQVKKQGNENKKKKDLKLIPIKRSLNWGLTLSAGISGIPNSFLGSLDKSYSYADALSASPQGNPQNNSFLLPSKIKPSGALVAGFFLEKNISKKKTLTVGLNYKKFSSTNWVGARNDTTGSYSLINPINTYHNTYHFLELPVSLQIQLTSKIIPLFWDVGISFSQLMSSNALQFTSPDVVYHKDNSLFNKTQAGFSTGLSASLFSRQKTAVFIGPYIYYGTSKIAAEGLYKNLHFTFIGVRSRILFKK